MSTLDLTSPEAAEAAFYSAFEHADVGALMAVWADHDRICCVHPMGELLVGRRQIRDSWRQICSGRRAFHVVVELLSQIESDQLCVRTVRETFLTSGSQRAGAPIIATNIYQQRDGDWHMVAHHASPSPQQKGSTHDTSATQMH